MAALQKLRLLATPCGVGQRATQSPRTSPLVQFRRPKTSLRSLLTLNRAARRQEDVVEKEKEKDLMRRHSLKELFVSSPPREDQVQVQVNDSDGETSPMLGSVAIVSHSWRGFRCRSLLKTKHWRPLLLTIPE